MPKALSVSGLTLAMIMVAQVAAAGPTEVVAGKLSTAPIIDGTMDDAWNKAKPVLVQLDENTYKPSNGYDGISATEVEIRALNDGEHLYMLIRYNDPTHSHALHRPLPVDQANRWKLEEDGE